MAHKAFREQPALPVHLYPNSPLSAFALFYHLLCCCKMNFFFTVPIEYGVNTIIPLKIHMLKS